jgi:hypothetical protein
MVTVQQIKNILDSPDFQLDLAEMSNYAASMKQERPIVLLVSKYLWRKGYKAAPELKKCDLNVEGTRVEFKFHFDSDVASTCGEMNQRGITLETLAQAIRQRTLHPTWTTTPGLYKDIHEKAADIFVWIICSRDLSGLNDENLRRVCWSPYQSKFNLSFPYSRNREVFTQAEEFLRRLACPRPFSIETSTVMTEGAFPSTYHFVLCDLKTTRD